MDGMMGGMWLFWIIGIIILILIIWLIVNLINKSSPNQAFPREKSQMNILKKRYAKGEITKEQFEEMRNTLEK